MVKGFDSIDKIVGDIISEVFSLNVEHTLHVPANVTPQVRVSVTGRKEVVMKTTCVMVDSHKSHRSRTFRRI